MNDRSPSSSPGAEILAGTIQLVRANRGRDAPSQSVCATPSSRENRAHIKVCQKDAGDVGVGFAFLRRRRRSYADSSTPLQPNRSGLARGLVVCLLLTATCLDAAQLNQARVTVVKDMKLGSPQAAPHRAAVEESVRDGDSITTGAAGRGELTFADQTIMRLGAKTNVTFSKGTRTMNLGEGAMLFQIPKGSREAKIKTGAIATASTGATGIIERHGQFYVKLLVLEGTVRCYLTNRLGESLLVQPGQILISKPDVTALPDPAHFDIGRVMSTCLLVSEFQPLPSQRRIESEEQKQLNLIARGTYVPSNLVIFGRGTLVNLVDPTPPPGATPRANTGD